jgi:molybdate transport system substrate-binding protein
VDLVIVAQSNMLKFAEAGYIAEGSRTLIARSSLAIAVREGASPPDASCAEALKRTLLDARSIAYSASESGKYLTTQLYQKLGIADKCLPKSRFVGGGERTGAVVARGDADLAFQQLSELRPVPGIAHITPIPLDLQSVVWVAAGVASWSCDVELAQSVVRFLASAGAVAAIRRSGLEPVGGSGKIQTSGASTSRKADSEKI